ncbi:hypothetical protein C5S29_06080 [ANME-1 cluster archaeon GoMg3.2]|nr:hypothetical protein [ANME-1 cluster archaeon GoMg3.2]
MSYLYLENNRYSTVDEFKEQFKKNAKVLVKTF